MSENLNSNRLQSYKNIGKNSNEMRQRRHDVTVELRKNKKDEQIFKRRNLNDFDEPTSPLQECNGQSPISMSMEEIVQGMYSDNPKKQFEATQAARKILSREKNPPIDMIINLGIVTPCVKFLECFENPDLQFEATWTLTNIASGDSNQTKAVIDAGAIPRLIKLLNCGSLSIADQAVWALGNIAGDGAANRDLLLNNNVVEPLLQLLQKDTNLSVMQNIAWFMSNLCRNKNPYPPFEKIKPMLPYLAQLLLHTDPNILSDACWAFSYISDDVTEKIQAIIDTGCLSVLVSLLNSDNASVITPALRAVGNIVTGTDQQTDAVIDAGALPYLKKLLKNSRSAIVKEATWTVSNIAAGHRGQVQALLNENIYEDVIDVLANGEFRSQKEAAWVITNTTTSASSDQLFKIVQLGVLKPFCDLLEVKDARVIVVVLNGIENICQAFYQMGGFEYLCMEIETIGALDKLENLQNHEQEEIYKKALKLIETYFTVDDDENAIAPETVNGEYGLTQQQNGIQNQEFNF